MVNADSFTGSLTAELERYNRNPGATVPSPLCTVSAPEYFQKVPLIHLLKKLLYGFYLSTERASRPLSWIKVCLPPPVCELPAVGGVCCTVGGSRSEHQCERWYVCLCVCVTGQSPSGKMMNGISSSVVMLFCLSDTASQQLLVLLKASYRTGWPRHIHTHVCTLTRGAQTRAPGLSPCGRVRPLCSFPSHPRCCYPELVATDQSLIVASAAMELFSADPLT